MKNTKLLFKHHLSVWQNQLIEAALQEDAATWLLTHNARNTLFYLEAMAGLFAQIKMDKTFIKLQERFKRIEDALGQMDYYAGLQQDFKSNRKIPIVIKNKFIQGYQTAAAQTNQLLHKQGWFGVKSRVRKIEARLKKVKWLDDAQFSQKLTGFYADQLAKLDEQLTRPLKEIEADVHELRRDVRWLSIYPQAFKGFMTLKPARVVAQKWQKYLTDEIIHSPYNQLTKADDIEPIVLNSNAFYAMSWLIASLGFLKDQGLRLEALMGAFCSEQGESLENAEKLALLALGVRQATKEEILTAAQIIVTQVKRDGVFKGILA